MDFIEKVFCPVTMCMAGTASYINPRLAQGQVVACRQMQMVLQTIYGSMAIPSAVDIRSASSYRQIDPHHVALKIRVELPSRYML